MEAVTEDSYATPLIYLSVNSLYMYNVRMVKNDTRLTSMHIHVLVKNDNTVAVPVGVGCYEEFL